MWMMICFLKNPLQLNLIQNIKTIFKSITETKLRYQNLDNNNSFYQAKIRKIKII